MLFCGHKVYDIIDYYGIENTACQMYGINEVS